MVDRCRIGAGKMVLVHEERRLSETSWGPQGARVRAHPGVTGNQIKPRWRRQKAADAYLAC